MERSRKKLPAKTENFGLRVVAPLEVEREIGGASNCKQQYFQRFEIRGCMTV